MKSSPAPSKSARRKSSMSAARPLTEKQRCAREHAHQLRELPAVAEWNAWRVRVEAALGLFVAALRDEPKTPPPSIHCDLIRLPASRPFAVNPWARPDDGAWLRMEADIQAAHRAKKGGAR